MSFTSFNLHPDLLRGVDQMGFTEPTPIQQDAIPPALEGRDLLACAMTGSGKTAAFLLPILHRLLGKPPRRHARARPDPTRELAAQIDEHRARSRPLTRLTGAAVYGGVGMGPQETAFRRGVDVIVATPGRLLDHFQYPYARLAGARGPRPRRGGPDARHGLPARHPPHPRAAARQAPDPALLGDHAAADRGPLPRDAARPRRHQHRAAGRARRPASPTPCTRCRGAQVGPPARAPGRAGVRSVLVFTRTKHRANRLAEFLERHGVPVDRIHGNRSQAQRTQALAGFKDGRFRVLVATDIAARGIDVDGARATW